MHVCVCLGITLCCASSNGSGKEGCGDDEQEDDNGKCCAPSFLGMDGGKFVCCKAEVVMADNGACPGVRCSGPWPFDLHVNECVWHIAPQPM